MSPFKSFNYAGDGNASILLYKTEDILEIFDNISNCDEEKLIKTIEGLLSE